LDQMTILVDSSWERQQGLKSTKNGKDRLVPISERVLPLLIEVLDSSPFKKPEDLVFSGRFSDKPLDHKSVQKDLKRQLARIGIDEAKRKERNITFHSSRHFFNSILVNGNVPLLKIQRLTGHQSDSMTAHYYRSGDLDDVTSIVSSVFEEVDRLLP
jgi:integrase